MQNTQMVLKIAKDIQIYKLIRKDAGYGAGAVERMHSPGGKY